MPRLLQSTLFPGDSTRWIEALKAQSRVVTLSSAHPTFVVGLESREEGLLLRHELVFGLFRTVWTTSALLDTEKRRLTCKGVSKHFESFEQTIVWEENDRGVSVQSELAWTGAKSGLEDLLLRSLLRFPGMGTETAASERPTQRIAMEGQAAA